MKKLLVLVLVLAMASLANAGLITVSSASVSGITISVSGTITNDSALALWTDYTTALSNFVLGSAVWPTLDASGEFFAIDGGDIYNLSTFATSGKYPITGELLKADFATGTVHVYAQEYDGDGIPVGDITTFIVPEPATIALLCLGGLLLRKKK